MEKITVVTKSYDGNEWVKSLAQSGIPQINKQIMSPWGLYTESLLTHGVAMPALPFEGPVGIFIMLRILRNNRGGYFYGASYRDAEIAYQAIQSLRGQYLGPVEQEAEGISNLLLPGVLNQKNTAIIEELLIPYLKELKALDLWDLPALYHHFIYNAKKSENTRKGKIFLIDEDPLSPLELEFVKRVGGEKGIANHSRENLFCHKPWEGEGRKEIFKAYGSYNEWREVLDRIIQEGLAYDQFLIGSPQEQRIAHLIKEQSFIPYTLGSGFESLFSNMDIVTEKRRKQAMKAGFIQDELGSLENEIRDSLLNSRGNVENSQSGKIHLTQVKLLPLIERRNVFIMGTEAYTGSQIENSILLDGDIIGLKSKLSNSDLRTSVEKTRQAIQDFYWTVNYLLHQNRNVTISYSYYDTAELRINAKPSIISSFEETFTEGKDAGYFSQHRIPLSQEEANGFLYYSGELNGTKVVDNQEGLGFGELEKLSISATEAESLIECPYRFALESLLGMEMGEGAADITSWLDPKQMGSLSHEIFARYHQGTTKGSTLEEDKILIEKISLQVIDRWIKEVPPKADPEREIKDIKALVEKYVVLKYRFGKKKVMGVEYSFEAEEFIPERLSIHGTADLIEEDSEGFTIIDVKTGRRIKQVDQDIKSCIQAILYCYLLEKEAPRLPVRGGDYLYPRAERIVHCDYDSVAKERALSLLEEALKAVETGEGWKEDKKEICTYCQFRTLCQNENKGRLFLKLIEEGVIS